MVAQSDMANDVPVLGPIGVAVAALGLSPVAVIGADPVRRGIIFHNPGTVNLRVVPANLTPTPGAGGIVVYPQTEETIYGDENLHVNSGWNAVADSAGSNPLTILNFTDNNQSVAAPEAVARLTYAIPIVSPRGVQVSALGTISAQVIGANPNRRGVLFSNPGPNIVAVCPSNLSAVIGAGSIVILPGAEKRIVARGRIRVNCAWNAIAATGSANSLTILEFV